MVITGVHIMAKDVIIICTPDQRPVVLHMVLPFLPLKPRVTMLMKTYSLVSSILLKILDVTPDHQVQMTIVVSLAHIMRPTVEIIVVMDIIHIKCSKMVHTVIPRTPVILSTWAKYQFHQLPFSTSRVEMTFP